MLSAAEAPGGAGVPQTDATLKRRDPATGQRSALEPSEQGI
jgi:hypothetical protein